MKDTFKYFQISLPSPPQKNANSRRDDSALCLRLLRSFIDLILLNRFLESLPAELGVSNRV